MSKRVSDFDGVKRKTVWDAFQAMPDLKNFLIELFEEEIEKEDSVRGVNPEKLVHKQGVVAGLEKGLGILNRTKEQISNE